MRTAQYRCNYKRYVATCMLYVYAVSISGDTGRWLVGSRIISETTLTDNEINRGVKQVKCPHWLAQGSLGSPHLIILILTL